jgi:hypothetical protein
LTSTLAPTRSARLRGRYREPVTGLAARGRLRSGGSCVPSDNAVAARTSPAIRFARIISRSTRRPIFVRHLPTAGRLSNDLASAPLRLYTKVDRGLLPVGLLCRPHRAARPVVWRRWRRPGPSVRSPPLTPVPRLPHPQAFILKATILQPLQAFSPIGLHPSAIPTRTDNSECPTKKANPGSANAAAGEQPWSVPQLHNAVGAPRAALKAARVFAS